MRIEQLYSSRRTKGFIVNGKFFLKVFHKLDLKTYAKSFRTVYRRSRPENEFFFSRYLRLKGIDVPEVLKFKSRKFLKFLSLDVGYTLSVYEPLRALDKIEDEILLNDLLKKTAILSAKLHSLSVRHGDLALSNFAYNGKKVLIIDLETMEFSFSRFQAAKEFADYLHDVWKNNKKADLFELLDIYLFHVNLSGLEKEKLRGLVEKKLKKWGIV